MTDAYTLTEDVVALPTGAWAATHRRTLRHNGRPVLALCRKAGIAPTSIRYSRRRVLR